MCAQICELIDVKMGAVLLSMYFFTYWYWCLNDQGVVQFPVAQAVNARVLGTHEGTPVGLNNQLRNAEMFSTVLKLNEFSHSAHLLLKEH